MKKSKLTGKKYDGFAEAEKDGTGVDNAGLHAAVLDLNNQNEELQKQLKDIQKQKDAMQEKNTALEASVAKLEADNGELKGTINDIKDVFSCPIGQEVIEEPVYISCQGHFHLYNRSDIEQWQRQHPTCPISGTRLLKRNIKANKMVAVKKALEILKKK